MHYLRSCLSGEAFWLISNTSVSSDAFASAWKMLLARYENKRLLITTHLDKLVFLKPIKVNSASELRSLHRNQKYRCASSSGLSDSLLGSTASSLTGSLVGLQDPRIVGIKAWLHRQLPDLSPVWGISYLPYLSNGKFNETSCLNSTGKTNDKFWSPPSGSRCLNGGIQPESNMLVMWFQPFYRELFAVSTRLHSRKTSSYRKAQIML